MNKFVIKILNQIYFLVTTTKKEEISIDKFFYPLDSINNWNKIYGSKGFISYQCSIPFKNSLSVIENILQIIKLNKIYSFVSVLKSMGYNGKYTSFGQKGYTLVFDFPYYYNIEKTLKELDETVHKNNGRIYLCKDSRVLQKKFMKINKEFNKKEFVDLRRSKKFFFNSIQSERLKI